MSIIGTIRPCCTGNLILMLLLYAPAMLLLFLCGVLNSCNASQQRELNITYLSCIVFFIVQSHEWRVRRRYWRQKLAPPPLPQEVFKTHTTNVPWALNRPQFHTTTSNPYISYLSLLLDKLPSVLCRLNLRAATRERGKLALKVISLSWVTLQTYIQPVFIFSLLSSKTRDSNVDRILHISLFFCLHAIHLHRKCLFVFRFTFRRSWTDFRVCAQRKGESQCSRCTYLHTKTKGISVGSVDFVVTFLRVLNLDFLHSASLTCTASFFSP